MSRRSSVGRLPAKVRARISALRREGATIDEIMAALGKVGVSRSALGRHTQKLDAVLRQVEKARLMSGAIAERLGQEEVATGRVNEQIMQGLVLDLLSSSEGEMVLDAKQISTLARALSDLARAQKAHMDVSALARRHVREQAEKAVQQGTARKEQIHEAMRVLGLDG